MGRQQYANYVFPDDKRMSGVHFSVECGKNECRLRDLGSSNGTFLNGERVEVAAIYDGDEIQAGGTVFAVQVKGGGPPPKHRPVKRAAVDRAGELTEPDRKALLDKGLEFRAYCCRSGLVLRRGVASDFDVAEIAMRLSAAAPLYVVAAPCGPKETAAQPTGPAERVFDWVGEEDAGASPTFIGPMEEHSSLKMIAETWGRDRQFCVFDSRPRQAIVEQLRSFARPLYGRFETRQLACFRPSELAVFLTNGEPDDVARLVQGVTAVLIEVHQGERWAVLGGGDAADLLGNAGFHEAPAWA